MSAYNHEDEEIGFFGNLLFKILEPIVWCIVKICGIFRVW